MKDRETKPALAQKAKHKPRVHIADVMECRSCHNQMKKGESVDEWIQCEECDRSWHKTCVGYPADTDIASIAWSNRCKNGEKLRVVWCVEYVGKEMTTMSV